MGHLKSKILKKRDILANNNFINLFYKILCIVMFIIFIIMMILTNTSLVSESLISVFVVLIGAIIYIMFLIALFRKFKKMQTKTHDKIALLLFVLSFLFASIWGITHKTLFLFDLSHIVDKVQVLLNTNSHIVKEYNYFSNFPHQIPLFSIIYFVELFGKAVFHNPENTMILFNCFLISLTFYLVYQIIKELFNSKIALIGMIILVLYPDFYLFASYYYTDIVSIPFTIIGFYFLVKAAKKEKIKKYLFLIVGGIFFAIGTKVRVVSSFLLIAYLLDLLLKNNIKEIVKKSMAILIPFFGIYVLYNTMLLPYFKIQIDKSKTLPLTHFIMMGSNPETYGRWSIDEVRYTQSSKNKVNANIKKLQKRLKNEININFLLKKTEETWAKPYNAFAYYASMDKLDESHSFVSGYNVIFLSYILQIMKLSMYFIFTIMIGTQLAKKNKLSNSKVSMFVIALFGAFFFYVIWEAQSRYSFSFLPWIVIGGASSIALLDNFLKVKNIRIEHKIINLYQYKKYFAIFLLIITVLFLFDGFITYSVRKKPIDVVRINQKGEAGYYNIIRNKITQYFTLERSFNKIVLTFLDDHIEKEIPYIFELYDEKDKLIYETEFLSPINQETSEVEITFPKVKLKKKTKYHFKIYSNKTTLKNYLKIVTYKIDNCLGQEWDYKNKGYDAFPTGETYTGDTLICNELTLKVYEHKVRNQIRKKYYLPFATVILIITVFSCYTCLLKKEEAL